MDEKEKIIKYTDDDLVKVYRVAFEEGIRQGAKNVIDSAGQLASGFTTLKIIIDEMYSTKQPLISTDPPNNFELEMIKNILKKSD